MAVTLTPAISSIVRKAEQEAAAAAKATAAAEEIAHLSTKLKGHKTANVAAAVWKTFGGRGDL